MGSCKMQLWKIRKFQLRRGGSEPNRDIYFLNLKEAPVVSDFFRFWFLDWKWWRMGSCKKQLWKIVNGVHKVSIEKRGFWTHKRSLFSATDNEWEPFFCNQKQDCWVLTKCYEGLRIPSCRLLVPLVWELQWRYCGFNLNFVWYSDFI